MDTPTRNKRSTKESEVYDDRDCLSYLMSQAMGNMRNCSRFPMRKKMIAAAYTIFSENHSHMFNPYSGRTRDAGPIALLLPAWKTPLARIIIIIIVITMVIK